MSKISSGIMVVVVLLVVIVGAGVTAAYGADSALPGEGLYSLDLYAEGVVRNFTTDSVELAEYEMEILDERVGELEELEETESFTGEESEYVDEALEKILEQEERARNRMLDLEGEYYGGEVGQTVMEQVQNMWQEKVESQEKRLEQVESKLESSRGEAPGKLDDVTRQFSQSNRDAQDSLEVIKGAGNNGNN